MSTTRERAAFRERLAFYILGVSIGLILLGFFYSARQRAAAARQGPHADSTPAALTTPPPAAPPAAPAPAPSATPGSR